MTDGRDRAEALATARKIRLQFDQVLNDLNSGRMSVAEVLSSTDPIVSSLKVVTVLENLPGLGKVAARRTMTTAGLVGSPKIRELDARQVQMLIELCRA